MCVFLFRSPRVLKKMTREREKETRVDESKKKRQRKDHFFSSFLCKHKHKDLAIIWHLFLFFSFLQNTNEKGSKNFVRLKIYMDVWI